MKVLAVSFIASLRVISGKNEMGVLKMSVKIEANLKLRQVS